MNPSYVTILSVIAAVMILGAIGVVFITMKEKKIRIVIDDDDMDGFLKVMNILKGNTRGVEYNDTKNVIMNVIVLSKKFSVIMEELSAIPNIEVLEVR